MGVLSTNRTQIVAGGLISASYVRDIYDVLTGNTLDTVSISGSLSITGSIIGNLVGTSTSASYAVTSSYAISASYSTTSSHALTAVSSSYVSGSDISTISGSIQYLTVTSNFISQGTVLLYTASLPTTDPGINGQLWRSGSYLMIST
jgi:hypothetical protein